MTSVRCSDGQGRQVKQCLFSEEAADTLANLNALANSFATIIPPYLSFSAAHTAKKKTNYHKSTTGNIIND